MKLTAFFSLKGLKDTVEVELPCPIYHDRSTAIGYLLSHLEDGEIPFLVVNGYAIRKDRVVAFHVLEED